MLRLLNHRRVFVLAVSAASAILSTPFAHGAVHAGLSSWIWQNPLPQGNDLNATSCPTSITCYAVGALGTILATTNGGATWNGQSSPTQANLVGISCPSTTTCVAVGDNGTILFTTTSGAAWNKYQILEGLTGVSCPSTTVCYAVGPSAGIWATFSLGSLGWNRINASTGLQAISCPNPASSAAVCYLAGGATVSKLHEIGSFWLATPVSIPPVSNGLVSISCPDANTCAAAAFGGTTGANVIGTTNAGASWTSVVLTTLTTLKSISCVESTAGFFFPPCYAVGGVNEVFQGAVNSTSWSKVSANDTFRGRQLNGISCQPTVERTGEILSTVGLCYAVGFEGVIVTNTPSSKTWTLQETSIATSFPLGEIIGVSCPQPGTCFAVGDAGFFTSSSGGPWTLKGSALNTDNFNGNPISCPTATDCFVVGQNSILASKDGGASWHQQYPAGAPTTNLSAVSCPSTIVCVAAGDPYSLFTTNGNTWAIPLGNPIGGAIAVSCPSTTTCMAVAPNGNIGFTTNLGPTGGTWTLAGTPASASGSGLSAVSCPTTTTCLAVGGPFGLSFLLGSFNTSAKNWGWDILTSPPLLAGDTFSSVACLPGLQLHCDAITIDGVIVGVTVGSNGQTFAFDDGAFEYGPVFGISCAGTSTNSECAAVGYEATILTKTVGNVGIGFLTPTDGSSDVGEDTTFQLTWTVPAGQVWRDLQYLDVKLVDHDGAVGLWSRFMPGNPTSVFALLDSSGNIVSAGAPGTGALESPAAILDLSKSTFAGTGPTGPSVTVTFDVSFTPAAAGNPQSPNAAHVYDVEITAADLSGTVQAPERVGSWAVRAIHP